VYVGCNSVEDPKNLNALATNLLNGFGYDPATIGGQAGITCYNPIITGGECAAQAVCCHVNDFGEFPCTSCVAGTEF
jgi:hypothetical protein